MYEKNIQDAISLWLSQLTEDIHADLEAQPSFFTEPRFLQITLEILISRNSQADLELLNEICRQYTRSGYPILLNHFEFLDRKIHQHPQDRAQFIRKLASVLQKYCENKELKFLKEIELESDFRKICQSIKNCDPTLLSQLPHPFAQRILVHFLNASRESSSIDHFNELLKSTFDYLLQQIPRLNPKAPAKIDFQEYQEIVIQNADPKPHENSVVIESQSHQNAPVIALVSDSPSYPLEQESQKAASHSDSHVAQVIRSVSNPASQINPDHAPLLSHLEAPASQEKQRSQKILLPERHVKEDSIHNAFNPESKWLFERWCLNATSYLTQESSPMNLQEFSDDIDRILDQDAAFDLESDWSLSQQQYSWERYVHDSMTWIHHSKLNDLEKSIAYARVIPRVRLDQTQKLEYLPEAQALIQKYLAVIQQLEQQDQKDRRQAKILDFIIPSFLSKGYRFLTQSRTNRYRGNYPFLLPMPGLYLFELINHFSLKTAERESEAAMRKRACSLLLITLFALSIEFALLAVLTTPPMGILMMSIQFALFSYALQIGSEILNMSLDDHAHDQRKSRMGSYPIVVNGQLRHELVQHQITPSNHLMFRGVKGGIEQEKTFTHS